MQSSDRAAFLEVVIGFAELKGKTLSAPALQLYWNSMQDWELPAFRAAAEHLLKTCEFMPTPKDFSDLRKASRPTSGEAWAAVLKHLRGGYRTGGLSAEIDRAVAALGGYRHLAMMQIDQLPWQEKRFAEHYAEARDTDESRHALGKPDWLQLQSGAVKRLTG